MKPAHPGMVVVLQTRTQRALKDILSSATPIPQTSKVDFLNNPVHPAMFSILKSNHSQEISSNLTAACQEVNSGQRPALLTAGVEALVQSQLESPCQGHSLIRQCKPHHPWGFLQKLPRLLLGLVLSESSMQFWDRTRRVFRGCEAEGHPAGQ